MDRGIPLLHYMCNKLLYHNMYPANDYQYLKELAFADITYQRNLYVSFKKNKIYV